MKYIYLFVSLFLLVSFDSVAQTPEQLMSWLPTVDGWTLEKEVEVFDENNLFDRINGAAPLYIENNFVEMTAMEYIQGDQYITIQTYRHATPEDAFGMYASERSSDLSFLPIGGEAQGDESHLYLFAGNLYVKMWSNASGEITSELHMIGKTLANQIDSEANYPALIGAFPETDLIPYSEAYITANYIGHEFLKSVYTAKYEINGEPVQAFIIDTKSPVGARELLDKYFTFTKQPLDYQEGELLIKDRYNGNIPAYWKGAYIVGIFNENGNDVSGSKQLIEEITKKL